MEKRENQEQLFLSYILEHPEVKIVISSTPLMVLLKALKTQASSVDDLHQRYPQFDRADLVEMIDVLSKLGLVRLDEAGYLKEYFLTDKAREFLKFYQEGKKAFNVLGN